MSEFTPREPDYKGDGAAMWLGETKEGKRMVTVKILNSITVKLYKYEPKPKEASL